jgi:hypothetical protein
MPRTTHEPEQPPEDVAFDITTYPDEFIDCREGRHQFPPGRKRTWRIAATDAAGDPVELSRVAMCPLCKTILRELMVVATGEKRRNTYRHPVGYRVPKKTGKTQRDFRREQIRRAIESIQMEREEL